MQLSRVIVNFVPKFVAMATGVGRGKILMTLSNSLGPKIGDRCKQRAIIFYWDRVIRFEVPTGCNTTFFYKIGVR